MLLPPPPLRVTGDVGHLPLGLHHGGVGGLSIDRNNLWDDYHEPAILMSA